MHKRELLRLVKEYVLIALGSASYAAGFQFFFYPNDIVSGGVTGISMIINYLTGFPVGTMIILINLPLFAFAWRKFGLRFMIGSFVGMSLSSLLMDVFATLDVAATGNMLLACIYGGLLTGLGLGLIYLGGATTGGVDIVVKFIRRLRPHMNFGTIMLLLDVTVIMTFALVFDKFESAMYSIIGMFISSRMLDTVLYGLNTSKVCYIISDNYAEIRKAITEELDRGVTYLHGEGAFTGQEKRVILCVIKQQQIAGVRRIIRGVDRNAFMIVTDAREVFGDGFGNIESD